MDEFGSQLGRFSTMTRLFGLVDQLPRSQQLVLLVQLLGHRLPHQLYKLVLEMSDLERQQLLEQLTEASPEPSDVTTLTLDDEDAVMRQLQRRACRLRAVCVIDANTVDGIVTDISTVGMFIKTERSYPVGKPLRISCRLPGLDRPLILSGDIIRSEPTGIGVRLDALRPEQERTVRAFINSRDTVA
jgi:hypothetical protein